MLHRQGRGSASRAFLKPSVSQPLAKPGIVNLRFAVPEFGRELAFNLKIAEPQLDCAHGLGEMAPYVGGAHHQPNHLLPLLLGSYDHDTPHSSGRSGQVGESYQEERIFLGFRADL
jgi:hypothetical protein